MSANSRLVRYYEPGQLAKLRPLALQEIRFRGNLRTLRLPGNEWAKLRFCSDEEIGVLMASAARLGLRKDWYPSSWSSLFHAVGLRPRPAGRTLKLRIPTRVYGAWEEARHTTGFNGRVREYDLISAYAWAGFRSLPVLRSAEIVDKWSGPGIYLCRIRQTGGVLIPPHLRVDRDRWLTSEEIEELNLRVDIREGMIFHKWWEPQERIRRIIEACRHWKKVFRAYWGSWASPVGPTCFCPRTGKTWSLQNPYFDPVAAHYIVSRVRNRIAAVARQALHIYVDAVVTPEQLPEGSGIGDWKMKNQFEKMVIKGAGRYLGLTTAGESVRKESGGQRLEIAL